MTSSRISGCEHKIKLPQLVFAWLHSHLQNPAPVVACADLVQSEESQREVLKAAVTVEAVARVFHRAV